MRILLAVHAYPPRSVAGVEVYTARLAAALRRLDQEVLVLAAAHDLGAPHASRRHRSQDGVDVVEVVNVRPGGSLRDEYDDPAVGRAVRAAVAEFRPHCIHVQHLLNLSTEVLTAGVEAGARVLLTLHDHWLGCARDGLRMRSDLSLCATVDHEVCAACLAAGPHVTPPLQRLLVAGARAAGAGRFLHAVRDAAPAATEAALRWIRRGVPPPLVPELTRRKRHLLTALAHVDTILAPTSFVRDRAVEEGAPSGRIQVLPLGAVQGPSRPRTAGPRPRLAYAGTLAPHKGVHVLVEAFRRLASASATLDIYGSPALEPAYVAGLRRAAAGDARIRFRGPFPEGGQREVLASADALVVPSLWWENSPLTLLEAVSAGLPVIASATGGVPEVLPAGSGLLVPPGDADALAAALADVVTGRRLGEAAPPAAVKTADEGARELLALYARPSMAVPA